VHAIAALAKEDIPESVLKSYSSVMSFGKEYLIPKPFDPRLLLRVSVAVAKAAMDSGVAQNPISLDTYVDELEARLGVLHSFIRKIKRHVFSMNHTYERKLRVVFPEGSGIKILKAVEILKSENICEPILLGNTEKIKEQIRHLNLENALKNIEIVDPQIAPFTQELIHSLFQKRARQGITRLAAHELVVGNDHYFASLMVELGYADTFLSGVYHNYDVALKPALHVIGTQHDKVLAGIYMLIWKDKSIFIADATVNIEPDAELLCKIAIKTYDLAKNYLTEKPRVAMLSFSNFGSSTHPEAQKMCLATEMVKKIRPDIEIDGEMQADFAVNSELRQHTYDFSSLTGDANILIFPNLSSSNIAYKLLNKCGGATLIGPLLVGMNKDINIFSRQSNVEEIVNLTTFSVHRLLLKKNKDQL
jgi:malate dehydrogenase (oxaloacetate-decarboxylating)(NADP+)